MKKKVFVILSLFLLTINVSATSGSIKQNSVIKCDGINYGYHGSPKHWHKVKLVDDKWVIVSSDEVVEPSCYGDIENEKITVTLSKCVDGDTAKFLMSDGEVKTTRFLAIDTPETVHPTKEVEKFGREASDYTCKLLTEAKNITLEFDKNSDREDKYGRLLAFVYADDVMVQKELIKVGYAKVAYLYADYTYTDELKSLEEVAKNDKIGIWKSDLLSSSENEVETKENIEEEKGSFFEKIFVFIGKLCNKILAFFQSVL